MATLNCRILAISQGGFHNGCARKAIHRAMDHTVSDFLKKLNACTQNVFVARPFAAPCVTNVTKRD